MTDRENVDKHYIDKEHFDRYYGRRAITLHHDGHGLNESIWLTSDQPDQSGAAHSYIGTIGSDIIIAIQFQKGPRNVAGSTPGATEAALLAILIDRLEGFQEGPYSCTENAIQLDHLKAALAQTKARADARAQRGVLGQNIK